ncbi:MAG: DUF262 domain-containing protein [Sporocytophaga sp.]|nr:DUF262 domain-containing protein [Sporocytophaga sp.]
MSNFLQTTHRDISWFKQAHELGQLQMKPPFQRNPVWTPKQQSFLMDTILNGYPIPEIYLQDLIDENGDKKYVVVDGQQRITACLDFIFGNFSIDAKDSPAFADISFDDLKPDQKKKVFGYQFVVRLLPEISDAEIRDIFQRLNRNNVALNPQELRQATYWGPFIQTMNEVADMEIWSKLDIFTSNDIKRMLDVEFVSELTIAYLHGLQNKKVSLDKYYELYEEEFPERSKVKEMFDYVLREIIGILPNIGYTRWVKKTDFYTLFVYFSKKKNLFPLHESKRKELGEILLRFGNSIDDYLNTEKTEGDNSTASENVRQYSLNIRASSDLGARKKKRRGFRSRVR